jgi:predicted ArsR family transcriptional regulator
MTPARARVLELLQQSADAVTVHDLAEHLDQHPNTVREHLDALVDRGLANRSPGISRGRGRPATRYSPSTQLEEPDTRVRGYAMLALVLADHLAGTSQEPEAEARDLGMVWGRQLTQGDFPRHATRARSRTVSLLSQLGFDPVARRGGREIVLRRCPLLDVARQRTDVVCSMHRGMVAAAVEAFGGDGDRVGLHPFAEAQGCLVTLGESGARP